MGPHPLLLSLLCVVCCCSSSQTAVSNLVKWEGRSGRREDGEDARMKGRREEDERRGDYRGEGRMEERSGRDGRGKDTTMRWRREEEMRGKE